ncbi:MULTISPECIES: hypothetical protein [unclassified Roseovarius]|uniref:hypothetical protein n=1 Tax=unclassified Roseovarius TaxID=2614913 RepID=UPI00273E7BDF|nr:MULTISPECIES: hypothetical protein [unclassified Roseovarius]
MIGIVFVAMFAGSLSAVSLVFSGWPLWIAMMTYVVSGLLGMVIMAAVEAYHPNILRGLEFAKNSIWRLKFWHREDDAKLKPRPIPALSECQFHSVRK